MICSIRDVLRFRSNGSSVWLYLERLELESGLPECLVDFLLVFPVTGWRQERARKVAESLNNIAVSDLVTVLTGELYYIVIFLGSLLSAF